MIKNSIGIIAGLLLALALTGLLGQRLVDGASAQFADRLAERTAIMRARALAALVEAALAPAPAPSMADEFGDPGASMADEFGDPTAAASTSTPDLPALVRAWLAARPECERARVLQLSGAQVLASTASEDTEGERLAREQKPFFDLAKELQAGIDTNRDEGVFRKRELAVEATGAALVVTVPYQVEGAIKGVVAVTVHTEAPTRATPSLWSPLPLAAVLALAALLLWLPGLRGRGRIQAAVLALALLGLDAYVNFEALVQMQAGRRQVEVAMYDQYKAVVATTVQCAEAIQLPFSVPDKAIWDCDGYRRPSNFYAPDGTLNEAAIQADEAAIAGPLGRSLWMASALGLALFLVCALGLVAHVGRTLYQHRSAYGYVAPAMVGMLVLVFFPFLYGLALSFTGQTLYNTDKPLTDIWVGFDNYATILADWDVIKHTAEGWAINYQNFYWTAFITICWTVCNVAIGVTVGLGLALCLNTKNFGVLRLGSRRLDIKPLYRGILVLPWALPTYVTALIWKGLFHKQFGPINQILQIFGVSPISWFDSVFSSFITGITVNGWLSFPFMMLISLGGLQSISADMYEAARLDGASRFQQFRYITLPSLKPTLIPAIIISVVWTFNLFNVIYLVSAGEPGGANEILVTQAYKIAFEKYQYGYAAAYATVIFIILLTYGIFQNKMSKATEDIRA